MVCWRCEYYKTPYTEKPCMDCKDKSNFKLWEAKKDVKDE